jgi:uridine kinase
VSEGINAMNMIIDKFVMNYSLSVKIPYVIGVCGGSGSGKTFISNLISETINRMFPDLGNDIVVISQDSYYKGGNASTNFDDPISIEFGLLIRHIEQLISGYVIDCPIYDFTKHRRKKQTRRIYPAKIIIIEGILIFTQERLRDLMNMKIFVNTDLPTQIFRRTIRDINERGRTIESVKEQYVRDVGPSYEMYILPSSRYADMIINNFNGCFVGPQIMLNHIVTVLRSISKCDKIEN